MSDPWLEQRGFQLRFGWGLGELHSLGPVSDVVVIVDVLRFTTAVSVAVDNGAEILPYRWQDPSAQQFADEQRALLAGRREERSWSRSPTDLRSIPAGTRLVLPSPNGATLTLEAAQCCPGAVIAASLRNASAVGSHVADAVQRGETVSVIAAGETGAAGMRHAVEDLLGAGAVMSYAPRDAADLSPEARSAEVAFQSAEPELEHWLKESVSGRELMERGWTDDVELAAELSVSAGVPFFDGLTYRRSKARA